MTNARDLTARLAELLRLEHTAMADFLVALADFDRRKLWRALGHASLFSFLRRELGLSAGAAQYRKTAAELVQRFPEVEAALRDGRLCLSSVIELAKVITPESAAEVLPRFFGLSSRDAAFVAASIRPVEDAPRREVVAPLRVAPRAAPTEMPQCDASPPDMEATLPLRAPEVSSPAARPHTAPAARPMPAPPARTIEPLDADRARLHITVSRRFLHKLEAARAALSHSHPNATTEEILEAGLDLVLARHAKRRGLVEKPRKDPPAKPATSASQPRGGWRREHVPAHVQRAVWRRDGGRCQWPLGGGGICGSTHQVEFDHIEPVARGGPSTIENSRLLCRPHQDLAARKVFGDEWMDRFTRRRSSRDAARTITP